MSAREQFAMRHYDCPKCGGGGMIFVRHPSWGSSTCPYEGDDVTCGECMGDGYVIRDRHEAHDEGLGDGWLPQLDGMLVLHNARRLRSVPDYQLTRESVMRPTLRQLRMIEAAIGCTNATDAAVAAWRQVA